MEKPKPAPDEPMATNRSASLTIQYDGQSFQSTLTGEMPIIPLLGVMMTQMITLAARQIASQEHGEAIARAQHAAKGGKLFMPDGTPYSR